KYRGVVNPRLRSFIQSNEYRELLTLLKNVNDEGVLDDFLAKAETYWMDINIFQLAMEEQSGGGRGVVATVKKDWPKIWPPQLESNRMYAFDCFAKFWGRLERSKLVDDVMSEVLPDLGKDYNEKLESKDQQKLMKLSDDERRDEIMNRLGGSPIVAQYAGLSREDPEVKAIGSKMAPFVAKFVSILERKVSTQTESLGQTVDVVVVGVIAVVVEDEPYEATASKEQFDVVGNEGEREWPNTNPTVHGTIEKYFRPDLPPKFWHGGKEWLSYVEGTGTRKRASAHVVLVRGTGIFRVNGEQDMYSRWPQIYNRVDVCQPFKLTGTAGQYDVFVATRGGGLSGQAGATRLAISRALFQANPSCHDDLQKGFCLLEVELGHVLYGLGTAPQVCVS
ncbi:rpsI, partial [Symbiodinium sp. KB8]